MRSSHHDAVAFSVDRSGEIPGISCFKSSRFTAAGSATVAKDVMELHGVFTSGATTAWVI